MAKEKARLRKLVVHIEYEADPSSLVNITEQELQNRLDVTLSAIREENEDFGWRFFRSLGDAEAWESGEKGIEEVGT